MHRSILHTSTTAVLVAFLALLVCSTASAQVIDEVGIKTQDSVELGLVYTSFDTRAAVTA